jgi:hypothetical protein
MRAGTVLNEEGIVNIDPAIASFIGSENDVAPQVLEFMLGVKTTTLLVVAIFTWAIIRIAG